MSTTFHNEKHPAGTIGYMAMIDRPSSSRAATCQTDKYPTRAAAVVACLERIDGERVKVKPTDTIQTTEWQASGDGTWQIELMKMLSTCERVTVAAARVAQSVASNPLGQAAIDSGRLSICVCK